ncbi:MerR family transcriptional regulator [Geovibrio sp. ADMFC3]|jgi:DNA-binding transcriptional MerR regulator|nr:MerR family transcriptional regulator [Deferribacteraceae bacterium]
MTDKLYYKIGEVCEITELKSSVLRFWEKEFKQLRPVKSGGGQRFYTKKHLDLIFSLKRMLYEEKLTIEGVRRKLSKAASEPVKAAVQPSLVPASQEEIRKELMDILSILKDK